MFLSGLHTASFGFEQLNSSLDQFKKTIIVVYMAHMGSSQSEREKVNRGIGE